MRLQIEDDFERNFQPKRDLIGYMHDLIEQCKPRQFTAKTQQPSVKRGKSNVSMKSPDSSQESNEDIDEYFDD